MVVVAEYHRERRGLSLNDLLHLLPQRVFFIVSSEPWEYLVFGGVGGYIGYKMPIWEAGLINDINEMRADRNMPPLEREGGIIFGGIIKDPKKA